MSANKIVMGVKGSYGGGFKYGVIAGHIVRMRQNYLIKHSRFPNVIIMGYGLFDNLVAVANKDMHKLDDGTYRFMSMRVLLYPEASFKDEFQLIHLGDKGEIQQ